MSTERAPVEREWSTSKELSVYRACAEKWARVDGCHVI